MYELNGSIIKIFFSDGTGFAKRKEGRLVELSDSYVRFVENKNNIEQVIPLYRIYRIEFLDK